MCTISDKLKLCTCKTDDIEKLEHYWVLYKYEKSDIIKMGLPVMPQEFEIGESVNENNYNKIEEMLNAGYCFDMELPLSNKDILELIFTCRNKNDRTICLVYEFVYRKNKWVKREHDPFDTDKAEKQAGKIINPFD